MKRIRFAATLFTLSILCYLCVGCVRIRAKDFFKKMGPTEEAPCKALCARRSADVVLVKYKARLTSAPNLFADENVCYDDRFAIFSLPHTEGGNIISGKRIRASKVKKNMYSYYVPIVPHDVDFHEALEKYTVIVWGSDFESEDVYILEKMQTGALGQNRCILKTTIKKREWWEYPARISLCTLGFSVNILLMVPFSLW